MATLRDDLLSQLPIGGHACRERPVWSNAASCETSQGLERSSLLGPI